MIRELVSLAPNLTIHIRSTAPPRVFEPLPVGWVRASAIDVGLVEKDPFTIDREASMSRLLAFMERRRAIIAEEVAVVRQLRPALIVADIPFLAGDVAAETGVPCVGISNFTWDWIYENLFGDDPRYAAVSGSISESYAKFSSLLELPFGKTCPAIVRKIRVPLIALQSRREPGDILTQLGIASDDRRPRALVGTRGSLASEILFRAAADAGEFLFLCPHETAGSLPPNAVGFALGANLDFSDVLRISDVVVSKLGYGMISECICAQVRLVWPPRDGFVEDDFVAAQAPAFVPMLRMPMENYWAGRWGKSLRSAMKLPPSEQVMATDGARVCASRLLGLLPKE